MASQGKDKDIPKTNDKVKQDKTRQDKAKQEKTRQIS